MGLNGGLEKRLSDKRKIHAISLVKGVYNGKRFTRQDDDELEAKVFEKYRLYGCSEQDDYSAFLESQSIKVLKEGKTYRIIEVPEGYFKVRFIFD